MVASDRALPLSGVRVADFTRVVAGPYCSYLLGRMGAEVVRIEDYDPVDSTRSYGPFIDNQIDLNAGGAFSALNAGKKSVSLHLSNPMHAGAARELVLSADVVLENFTFGTMKRFGLDYESLSRANPGIVMVSVTGFGQTGAMRSHRAYMNTVAAFVGLTASNGYSEHRQVPVGATFSDYVSGTSAALASLLALWQARETGRGQHVDLSMAEATMSMMGQHFMDFLLTGSVPRPKGNAFTNTAPCGVYPSKGDDKWIAISVSTDAQWVSLLQVMGNPDWAGSPRLSGHAGRLENRSQIDTHIAEWTRNFGSLDLSTVLQSEGVPAVPSSDPEDLVSNPHFKERGTFAGQVLPHGLGRMIPNLPWHFRSHPGLDAFVPAPPTLGQDNSDMLPGLTSIEAAVIAEIDGAVQRAAESTRSWDGV